MVKTESGEARNHLLPEENEMRKIFDHRWSSTSSKEKSDRTQDASKSSEPRVSGNPDELFALSQGPTRTSTFENMSRRVHEHERKSRRKWYPVILLAIALDLFLLIAIFYIIYEADYYSTDESGYYWRSCLIIFVPLVPVAVLLLWPFEGRWKTKRDHFSEEKSSPSWRHVANILNAVASFFFVLCYLFFSAIPKYNTPVWDTAVDFQGSIPIPAVAYAAIIPESGVPQGGSVFMNISVLEDNFNSSAIDDFVGDAPYIARWLNESVKQDDVDPSWVYRKQLLDPEVYPTGIDALVTNMSMTNWTLSPLQFAMYGQAFLSYAPVTDPRLTSISEVKAALGQIQTGMLLAAFDPRFTLEEVMFCSLVPALQINAYAINTMLMTVTQLSDPRKKMIRSGAALPLCDRAYSLIENADPPIALFDLQLTTSQTTTTNFSQECTLGEEEAPLSCTGGWSVQYGTQFITTQVSRPGKSKQDMWIDAGAIVGAVQFFCWFLLVYFQE